MPDTIDPEHVTICCAGPGHALELNVLHARLFDEHWSAPEFERLLAHPATTGFVARIGQSQPPVGFVLGQVAADEAEIVTLGVEANRRRRGIGRQLVNSFTHAAAQAGARRVHLEVAECNLAAVGLYRALGFMAVGRRKAYYVRQSGERPLDALRLQRAL